MNKEVLLFLGAPGAGKGTLAQRCCVELGYEQLSTGNVCREYIARATEIGKAIDLALKSGKLVDDSLITTMVTQWFAQHPEKQRVILDGYPRTVIQAETFDSFVREAQIGNVRVVHLSVSEQALIDRLSMRLICSKGECQAVYSLAEGGKRSVQPGVCDLCGAKLGRRPDDEVEAIKKRLKLYTAHEDVLISCYKRLGYAIMPIDASRAIEDVFIHLKTKLGSRL